MASLHYYVYITTNPAKTTLYIGMTNNLERRILEHVHNANTNPNAFTGKYHCCNLIYFEIYQTAKEALLREKQIKTWRREKKEALIATTNPEWNILTEGFLL